MKAYAHGFNFCEKTQLSFWRCREAVVFAEISVLNAEASFRKIS